MASIRFVQQERAFDSMFDPCFTSSAHGGGGGAIYRDGPAPVDTLQNRENLEAAVQGTHRYKFMKRPIVPFLHAVPPDILLAPPTVNQQDAAMIEARAADDNPTKTIGTQSDMRESEAQTDPFTPDYVVKEGETPEVLTLTAFKHGNGLPMGLREVELVERARLKRSVEASFPPVTDDRSFGLRAKMMETLESKQWVDREEDLKRDQDARLEKLVEQLHERSAALESKHEARVDQLRQVKLLQSENEVAIVQKRRIKAFRKLTEAQKHMVPTGKERDIIEEYGGHGSPVYAPLRREGQAIIQDKNSDRFETNPPQLETVEGLQQLEQQLPTKLVKSTSTKVLLQLNNKTGTAGRRALVEAQHLNKVHSLLKQARQPMQKDTEMELILKRYHKPPPLERPPTPSASAIDQAASGSPLPFADMDGAEVDVALILLQRLLRGRMVQNSVYEAKEKRRELIEELRSVEALDETQEAWEEARANLAKEQHDCAAVDSTLGLLQGDAVGRSLDYLSKELVHQDEEARLRAIMEQAEGTRAERETAETTQRRAEEEQRGVDDQMYLQLHECHQRSVDNYLDVLISNVMEDSAEERALADVKTKAEKLDTIVSELEDKYDAADSVMQDLVAHFLLPEVEREEKRWGLKEKMNKYKKAAYDAAYDESSA